ncbi:BON domain-containing protein [Hyphomicrobium sp.]|jgi:osmotically-inducible protein OsmY|uniref:BON domain-containing protein n=1 Tax=Hyphomicrobium sp. TaxID=82 RepID=UPI002CBDE977|nr:BON domain-containing protein [Hyphomicrobium sp.]HVZ05764.1 BON domain-containing protein [Hyphomicrobium sp.]
MDDKQLRQNIIDELEFEPSVDAQDIGVAVSDGVVTLSGHVSNYAEKVAAQHAVQRIKGVRAIAQEIEVRYPGEKKTADDEIAKRALNVLKWDAVIPEDMVKVTVQKGWVLLTGEVDWQFQKKAAEDAIRKLSGVTGVSNSITIKPRVSASDIKKKIEAALARNAHVEARAIRVNVSDGNKVRLEGAVDSWDDRDIVENAAWSVPGVQSVDDRLAIAL